MTVSGTANYVTTYCYDAANRLLSENCTGDGSSEMRCTYDADGNLLTRTVTSADGIAGATYQYDLFGQLVLSNEGGIQAAYAYNAQGIRTEKTTSAGWTQYLLDGGNVIGEQTDAELITYLRGVNLISRTAAGNTEYYLFNAHGDVTELTSNRAVVTKTYHYDAFGVETAPDPLDENPFRYCGEYFDVETGTYYLRARYYDPDIGRFTQQDTHWNTANSIYGDNPQKINEREDKLGLKTYSYAPQITAVMQSGNLYVYGVSNPVAYVDRDGQIALELTAAFLAVLAVGVANAVLPYLWKISVDFGKALAAFSEEFGAEICAISEKFQQDVYSTLTTQHSVTGENALIPFLPSFKKVKIDMEHILSGHSAGGNRGGPNKDRFPKGLTAELIRKAIEQAYKNAEKAGEMKITWSDGVEMVRQLFKGKWDGGVIYFWFNYTTNTIETAWPGK